MSDEFLTINQYSVNFKLLHEVSLIFSTIYAHCLHKWICKFDALKEVPPYHLHVYFNETKWEVKLIMIMSVKAFMDWKKTCNYQF